MTLFIIFHASRSSINTFSTFARAKNESRPHKKEIETSMKKRDYYFLALLFCLIIFATLHRTWNNKTEKIGLKELQKPHANTEIQPLKTDSIPTNINKVFKAGA